MNLQNLVVVVLRLMAIHFFLHGVRITPQILQLQQWSILGGLIILVAAILLLALPISKLITRDVAPDLKFESPRLIDLYSVAFMGLGLFYFSNCLTKTFGWFYYFFNLRATNPDFPPKDIYSYYIAAEILPFFTGILMFIYSRKWAISLARRQTASELN